MRIDDSGFRKRTVNNSLMTRQLILITRESKKMINTMGTPACTFKQQWDNVSGNCQSSHVYLFLNFYLIKFEGIEFLNIMLT